jgi:hypothetical protein
MNRTPEYARSRHWRIISSHGGLWLLQQYSGLPSTRTFDPWFTLKPPMPQSEARRELKLLEKGEVQ